MSRMVLGLSSFWLLLITFSFVWNYGDAQQQRYNTAFQSARSFFQQVILTRAWNASHGGVYVPVTDQTQPNPFLNIENRDLRISEQLTLTRINPAFMTRQIAELADTQQRDILIHITSLKPIRPANVATPGETLVLQQFENGLQEHGEILANTDKPQFFYMAPLKVEKSCFNCHEEQDYKEGDIRGGISVTLPFTQGNNMLPLLFGHLAIGIAGLAGILFAGRKLEIAYITIKNQSNTDFLTGLANRRVLMDKLNHSLRVANRENSNLALLLFDLDRFKDVNDSLGHPAGDQLLQLIASELKTNLREIDTIARLGGDEFALLLEKVPDAQDAAIVANKILHIFKQNWQLKNNHEVRISASIGISLFPAHGDNPELLMQHADSALYRAKADGRNQFHYYTQDLTTAAIQRLKLEKELRKAIQNKELEVYFQPFIDIKSNAIEGAEALLRWNHPKRGIILPGIFLPIAEESGLIEQIDTWVLRQACINGARWLKQNLHLKTIAINVSGYQFHHGNFIKTLLTALEHTGFPAQHLQLEITEAVLMERELESSQMLACLKKIGVQLAIDNFGTGYSCLDHLHQFPIDQIKIDQRFIYAINHAGGQNQIARAIIKLSQNLGLEVMAAGVESDLHLSTLQQEGCDLYQGHLYSKALPASEFEQLLEAQNLVSEQD